MDINTLRGLSTVLMMIAFFGICWWAFSPSRKQKFDDAAQAPFAGDDLEDSRRADAGTKQFPDANASDAPKQD